MSGNLASHREFLILIIDTRGPQGVVRRPMQAGVRFLLSPSSNLFLPSPTAKILISALHKPVCIHNDSEVMRWHQYGAATEGSLVRRPSSERREQTPWEF